ncbi:response regulator transcription factor [Marinobacterium stanieri]|uniref:response regulator transcription factor n=1 Tax=Marinobacterium stanieri TaxID=49186 RepID=UPI0004962A59|nr:response regulator transcription factor [Marinobacterium stanieri]
MFARSSIKLILVEDNDVLREMLVDSLESLGYSLVAYDSAESALASPEAQACDVAVLDVNLPGEDGLYLAQQLRYKNAGVGVILLTVRNQLADKLAGYEVGADMYLPKPVTPEELDATIQALCRRLPGVLRADLILHYPTHQLLNAEGLNLLLSPEDARLLVLLAQAPQARQEFWELAEHLELDLDSDTFRANLEKRISRLRRKLTQLGQPATVIKALRGYGYQLNCTVNIQ